MDAVAVDDEGLVFGAVVWSGYGYVVVYYLQGGPA